MLVDIVKVVKEHEWILVPSPSVIERLQLLQHCQCALPDPTIQLAFSALEGTSIFQDWEVERRAVSGNPRRIVLRHERPKDMIEGGSCVVEAVPDDERPVHERWSLTDINTKNILPRLSISFLDDGVGFSFADEGASGVLESAKVFLRPADLSVKSDWEISDASNPSSSGSQSC